MSADWRGFRAAMLPIPRLHTGVVRLRGRGSLVVIATISMVLLAACTTGGGTAASSTTPADSPLASSPRSTDASGVAARPPDSFQVAGAHTAEVAHLMNFVSAYNAGDVQGALSQFSRTHDLGFSDCDYATQQLVDGHGHDQVVAWMRHNIAEHDRLVVGAIIDEAPDQPLGVLGVTFSRRSSVSIAHSGKPNGITPILSAKIKFDAGGLITEFNNGPYGGSANSCRIG